MHRLAHAKAAGDVAAGVDGAKAVERLLNAGLHGVPIHQIDRQQQDVVCVVERRLQRVQASIRQHQSRATLPEGGGHGLAEMAGGAGDEHGLRRAHAPAPSRLAAW